MINVSDIGALIAQAGTGTRFVTESVHLRWDVHIVDGRSQWKAPVLSLDEQTYVVLDGMATFEVEGHRETLASGHLLVVEPGAALTVTNEAAPRLVTLRATTSGPLALKQAEEE